MSAARFLGNARLYNSRLLYRIRQFWQALRARPASQDLALIWKELSPAQAALFGRMQLSEQAHSLHVYRKLRERGEKDPDLLRAALLHDAGKSLYPLSLWERVLIVLARVLFPRQVSAWGAWEAVPGREEIRKATTLPTWRRPFIVAEQHPAWGARLAEQAGLPPRAVALIRRHQENLSNNEAPLQSGLEILRRPERPNPSGETGETICRSGPQNDAASLTSHPERSEESPAREEEIIHFLRILQSVDDES